MSEERAKLSITKPYMLLFHPGSGQSAVYNRLYEMISEHASPELIRYALRHKAETIQGFLLSNPEQRPSWMLADEMKPECISYYLHKDTFSDAQVREIPDR